MVLYQVRDCVKCTVNCSVVVFFAAEVVTFGLLLILRDVDCVLYKLMNSLVLQRGNRDDRHAQQCLHPVDVDSASVAAEFVHHVQRDD